MTYGNLVSHYQKGGNCWPN